MFIQICIGFLVLNAATVGAEEGRPLISRNGSLCGDWTPYKDLKCIKVVAKAASQTQQDSEVICKSYGEEFPNESSSKLLTIKSKEEQEFLIRYLFVENELVDDVWLGLRKNRNSGLFEWNDGSALTFSNWANQTVDQDHECVDMESGQGGEPSGYWFKVSCQRRHAVVCERRPVWSFETLQNAFLNFRVEQEKKQTESEEKQKLLEHKISVLESNPVPVGFVFVQLSHQDRPSILWPATKWVDISSNYSGLFFRVTGGNAAQFGEIQDGNSPRLQHIEMKIGYDTLDPMVIPPDGSWSQYAYNGANAGTAYGMRFRLSTDEVRPRNQAVRIWKRIK